MAELIDVVLTEMRRIAMHDAMSALDGSGSPRGALIELTRTPIAVGNRRPLPCRQANGHVSRIDDTGRGALLSDRVTRRLLRRERPRGVVSGDGRKAALTAGGQPGAGTGRYATRGISKARPQPEAAASACAPRVARAPAVAIDRVAATASTTKPAVNALDPATAAARPAAAIAPV